MNLHVEAAGWSPRRPRVRGLKPHYRSVRQTQHLLTTSVSEWTFETGVRLAEFTLSAANGLAVRKPAIGSQNPYQVIWSPIPKLAA